MGLNGAHKMRQIQENAYGVLGIEFIAAAQGLDFREYTPGLGTRAGHEAVRTVVDHLDEDRPLFDDHNNMMEAVENLAILNAVEEKIGPLEIY